MRYSLSQEVDKINLNLVHYLVTVAKGIISTFIDNERITLEETYSEYRLHYS